MKTHKMRLGFVSGVMTLPILAHAHGGEDISTKPDGGMIIAMGLLVGAVAFGIYLLWRYFRR